MKSIIKRKGLWLIAVVIVLAVIFLGGEEAAIEEEAEDDGYVAYVTQPENPVPMTGETISVYNWGDYIDPDVIDVFEAETGIKVIYETFETNEDMYAKIAMGGSSYDVIVPSEYMIERMIR